jgi:hypothetical protein
MEKDEKFREVCDKYGIEYNNYEVYDNVILLYTAIDGLYVLLDKNYNPIAVELWQSPSYLFDTEYFAKQMYERYTESTDVLPFGEIFDYPFGEYTLKNFIELSELVKVVETDNGRSLVVKVNGNWVDKNEIENKVYYELLVYIKFLSDRVKEYFLMSYHMKTMQLEVVDVYAYLRALIHNIGDYVSYCMKIEEKLTPSEILSSVGLSSKNLKDATNELYAVIDLYSRKDINLYDTAANLLNELDTSKKNTLSK